MLRLSYDGLNVEEKDTFLDIACFLKGKDSACVKLILNDYSFSTGIGISVLHDESQ